MMEESLMFTWIDDELKIVKRNKRFLEGHLLVRIFPELTDEISRYERSLVILKKCIEHGIYS